jgi:hypothetical protein
MPVRSGYALLVLGAALLGGTNAMADQAPAPPVAGCDAPEYRQFDFWIGAWTVTEGGQPAGRNRIEADLRGCVLFESWTSVDGGRGRSLNYYDRSSRRWHQSWIDDRGGVLELDGGWSNGSMVLEGERPGDKSGERARHRIAWTPNADGSVRQRWQVMKAQGSWETVFDGLYQRAP